MKYIIIPILRFLMACVWFISKNIINFCLYVLLSLWYLNINKVKEEMYYPGFYCYYFLRSYTGNMYDWKYDTFMDMIRNNKNINLKRRFLS